MSRLWRVLHEGSGPLPLVQTQCLTEGAADRTALGTGKEPKSSHHGPPIPGRLVLQLAEKFSPAHIGDTPGQVVIVQQVFDGQRLDTDHLVLADESGRQLVLKITTSVGDAGMDASDLLSSLLPILAALLLLGVAALGSRQILCFFGEDMFIARFLPRGERDHGRRVPGQGPL